MSNRGCVKHRGRPQLDCNSCDFVSVMERHGVIQSSIEHKVISNPESIGKKAHDQSFLVKCLSCEVKIHPKKEYCKSCKRTNGKKTKHFSPMKIERRIAKVEQKKNKPVVTRDLFGRENTYPVEQNYNICKKCKARFKPHKVGLIKRIGVSALAVFAIGPLGVFAGGVAKSLEADRDLCDECNYSALSSE